MANKKPQASSETASLEAELGAAADEKAPTLKDSSEVTPVVLHKAPEHSEKMVRVRALKDCFYGHYRTAGSVFEVPESSLTTTTFKLSKKTGKYDEAVTEQVPHLELVDDNAKSAPIAPDQDSPTSPFGKSPVRRGVRS